MIRSKYRFVIVFLLCGLLIGAADKQLLCDESKGPEYNISYGRDGLVRVTVLPISILVPKIRKLSMCPCYHHPYNDHCVFIKVKLLLHRALKGGYFCAFHHEQRLYIAKGGGVVDLTTRTVLNQIDAPLTPTNVLVETDRDAAKGSPHSFHDKTTMVIAARLKWDNCFNHQSFQALPLAVIAHEYQQYLSTRYRRNVTFVYQVSKWTGALLNLMGVPMSDLVMEESVSANHVVQHWVPQWNPLKGPNIRGIMNEACQTITKTLMERDFSAPPAEKMQVFWQESPESADVQYDVVVPWSVYGINRRHTYNLTDPNERYVVYLSRNKTSAGSRIVINEAELLSAVLRHLSPAYHLLVLRHTDSFDTTELLQRSWKRYAAVLHKAVMMISPHGGALNNLIWTPDHCQIVAFDEFPDRQLEPPVRGIFFHAWWMKVRPGSHGKYWIIEPTLKNRKTFYDGGMRVSPRDLMDVMVRTHLVKNSTVDWNQFPIEQKGFL